MRWIQFNFALKITSSRHDFFFHQMAEFCHFFLGKMLELWVINHSLPERRDILFFVCWSSTMLWPCFITCMGVPFPAGELDNTIQFNTLSVVSGFLWHSSKYLSRLEVLACKLDPDFNYMITILQLCPSLNY